MEPIPAPNPNPSRSLFADKTVRVIAIVAALSLLGLGGLYLKIYYFNGPPMGVTSEKNPSPTSSVTKTFEVLEELSIPDYAPKTVEEGDGSGYKPYVTADTEDALWREYQPTDIEAHYDPATDQIVVTWTDKDKPLKPYKWVVGYWHEPFDPSDKFFNIERLAPEEQVRFNETTPTTSPSLTKEMALDLTTLPSKKTVYIYVYLRLNIAKGKFVDFIYGGNGSAAEPIIVDLLQNKE